MSVNIRVFDSNNQEQFLRASSSALPSVPSRLAKPPLTLTLVWKVFLKRLRSIPVKEMQSTTEGKFGKEDVVEKIEGRFLGLKQGRLLSATEGLVCVQPVTKIKNSIYTHTGIWEHSGKDLKFRLSVYRYPGNDVLVVLTKWEVLPTEQVKIDLLKEQKRKEQELIDKALADVESDEVDEKPKVKIKPKQVVTSLKPSKVFLPRRLANTKKR